MKLKCNDCGHIFFEDDAYVETHREPREFGGSTTYETFVDYCCPCCDSDDVEEYKSWLDDVDEKEEEEEETEQAKPQIKTNKVYYVQYKVAVTMEQVHALKKFFTDNKIPYERI